MKTLNVAILGATGIIGQQFTRMLADHPMFNLTHLYASERSAGKRVDDIWQLPFFDCPIGIKDQKIEDISKLDREVDIVFSGLPSKYAGKIESELREQGVGVFSNAGSHRMDDDVPILIPEINGDHLELVKIQRERYGTEGFIITNSNCSAAGAAIYLGELDRLIPVNNGVITTYQALSGAGIGGVTALDITSNVIPHIANEEPKIIAETQKINASLSNGELKKHSMSLVANAARVGVIDGHLMAITTFHDSSNNIDLIDEFKKLKSPLRTNDHHIAPSSHLHYTDEESRPQPLLDVLRSDTEDSLGMVVHVGRLRRNGNSISSYVLVHNTIRGGAGGSILNAELAKIEGIL
ncbi:MAG: aspartate-semialdehyde dehydrogenase [Candidatus Kariarchaeaceae archaeon]|jgi:aspartate-semialdehyde dehydrogenase